MNAKLALLSMILMIPIAAFGGSFAVSIQGFAFHPSSLNINEGDTVVWTNMDTPAHSVVADNGSFASALLNMGQTFTHVFSTAGANPYHCGRHPSMLGSVTVMAVTNVNPNPAAVWEYTGVSGRIRTNPTNGPMVFDVKGGSPSQEVEVYNIAGGLVTRLEGSGENGLITYTWDTRSARGGVYLLRVVGPDIRPDQSVVAKAIVTK
jgi:hypothetical protein